MGMNGDNEYWVPECVREYLRGAGYSTRALEDMEPHVREWDSWMRAVGELYDYRIQMALGGCIRCIDGRSGSGPGRSPCGWMSAAGLSR